MSEVETVIGESTPVSQHITNKIYRDSAAAIFNVDQDDNEKINHYLSEMKYSRLLMKMNKLGGGTNKTPHVQEMEDKEKAISKLYLKSLCCLPNTAIQLIIDEHNDGIFKREQKTIDALVATLAERSLLK